MSAKTLFAAVVLAGLSLGLGAGSPTHAAGDDELTLAREYWRLDALFGGHAVPEQDELGNAARNLINFAQRLPSPRCRAPSCKHAKPSTLGKRRTNVKRLGKRWKR